MLQALLHNKIKSSFAGQNYKSSEDAITSSVIGLLQYLPSDLLSSILKDACGIECSFPKDLGQVEDVQFWERLDGKDSTTNKIYVEPDVLIVSEKYNIIIEVKKSDDIGQYRGQWENEIKAHGNSYVDDKRKLILMALGGNYDMREQYVEIDKISVPIYRASWFNLLHSICREISAQHPPHIRRLLKDVVNAFEFNGFFDIEWLNTLPNNSLSIDSISVFERLRSFSEYYSPQIPLDINTINIWIQ